MKNITVLGTGVLGSQNAFQTAIAVSRSGSANNPPSDLHDR